MGQPIYCVSGADYLHHVLHFESMSHLENGRRHLQYVSPHPLERMQDQNILAYQFAQQSYYHHVGQNIQNRVLRPKILLSNTP